MSRPRPARGLAAVASHRIELSPVRVAAAAALVLAAGGVRAQDCDQDGVPDSSQTFRWNGQGPGFWGSSGNWSSSSGGVPGADSLAIFDGLDGLGDEPYQPFFDGFAPLKSLSILSCEAFFHLGGSTLSVTGERAGCREFLVGGPRAPKITFLGGGQLRVRRGVIADTPGVDATLIFDGANSPFDFVHLDDSPLIVGEFGDGVVELIDARLVHHGPLVLGSRPGSTGAIMTRGTGRFLLSAELASDVYVGYGGHGFIGLEQEGVMDQNNPFAMRIGELAGGSGEVEFDGVLPTQQLLMSQLLIGSSGDGAWSVLDGSKVESQANVRAAIGANPGSSGRARVLVSSQWILSGSPLDIAPLGRGDLIIGEGSTFAGGQGVRAFVDGVIEGSGEVIGDTELIGGEIRPIDTYAETGNPQRLSFDGDLGLSGTDLGSGRFETGRMVYTLASRDPGQSMYADVRGDVSLDGTLRVDVRRGVGPLLREKYLVVEGESLEGRFAGVQTPVIEDRVIAVPLYSVRDASIEFVEREIAPVGLIPGRNLEAPVEVADAVLADVNGDGLPDLITIVDNGPGAAGAVRVAKNLGVSGPNGWDGFSDTPDVYSTLGDLPVTVAVGDVDGDALPDIVMLNRGPQDGQIRIRLNSATAIGTFGQIDPREITVPGDPADLTLLDYSGDGLLDIVTVFQRNSRGGSAGGVLASTNDASSGFDDSEGDTGENPGSVDSLGGEYEPKGVAVSSKTAHSVHSYGSTGFANAGNRGTGFPLFFLQEIPVGRDPGFMFTADLTGDRLDEIITADAESGTISVLVAQDFGEIIHADAISLDAGPNRFASGPGSIVAFDANDDRLLDIVYVALDEQGAPSVRVILNIGPGENGEWLFSTSRVLPLDGANAPSRLAVGDVDGDGEADLVVVRDPGGGPEVSTFLVPGEPPCNAADLSVPFGVLDLADINTFVSAFMSQQPAGDLVAPFGVFDLADINAFVSAFTAGCP